MTVSNELVLAAPRPAAPVLEKTPASPCSARPAFWQAQTPSYCTSAHRDDDLPGDRWHWSGHHAVELTREPAVQMYDGSYGPGEFNVVMAMADTDREPHIRMGRDGQPDEVLLTVPEALKLAGHLLALADLAAQGGGA